MYTVFVYSISYSRFAVREKYPVDRAHERVPPPTVDQWHNIFNNAKNGDPLKKILNLNLGKLMKVIISYL